MSLSNSKREIEPLIQKEKNTSIKDGGGGNIGGDGKTMINTEKENEIKVVEEELKMSSERFRHPKKSEKSKTFDTVETANGANTAKPQKLRFAGIEAVAVKKGGKRQEILKGVSGVAKPGKLTFIMGSSGAGKTTLLNILTGRNLKNMETRGEIFINGRMMSANEMKKLSAYVQQDDVFIGSLTVKETLEFAAKLRSPKKLSKDELDDIVDELLVMMSLKKCENTKVGSMTEKSLSRGERKRLAFACEILTDPPILFCDEPTSGLDAFMSHQVIKSLRQLTLEGKTVVCTIHQPSTSVFQMADNLILLSQGHVAYAGPANAVDGFFAHCGFPIPKFISSPDHFMKVISHQNEESEKEYNDRIDKIVSEHEANHGGMNSSQSSSKRDIESPILNPFPRSWFCQFCYIFHRSTVQLSRDKPLFIVKFIQTVIMAFLTGLVYFGLKIEKNTLQSFNGLAFLSVQMMHMLFMMPALTIFWKDYPVVIREYQSNMYSPSAYYLSKTAVDSLQYSIFPLIFCSIILFLVGLPVNMFPVVNYYVVMILLSLNCCSLAQAFGAMCGSIPTAMTVITLVCIPFMVFGGFLISYDAVPIYFKFLSWISWYKYGFEAITIGYFKDHAQIRGCDYPNSTSVVTNNTIAEITCSDGPSYIASQNFSINNLWLDYVVILTSIVFWKTLGTLAFCRRVLKA